MTSIAMAAEADPVGPTIAKAIAAGLPKPETITVSEYCQNGYYRSTAGFDDGWAVVGRFLARVALLSSFREHVTDTPGEACQSELPNAVRVTEFELDNKGLVEQARVIPTEITLKNTYQDLAIAKYLQQ